MSRRDNRSGGGGHGSGRDGTGDRDPLPSGPHQRNDGRGNNGEENDEKDTVTVEYVDSDTGEIMGTRNLTVREAQVARLLQSVRQSLSSNDPMSAFGTLLVRHKHACVCIFNFILFVHL